MQQDEHAVAGAGRLRKILVDAIPYDHGASGISVYVRNVIRALEQAGHEVTVLAAPDDVQAFPESRVLAAPRWASGAIGSIVFHAWSLPRLLRKGDYDFCLVTAANRRFPAKCPIPVIGTVHDLAQCRVKGKYDNYRNFYLNQVLARWVRRGALGVVAISKSTLQDIVEYWKIPTSRISLIYNGLSLPAKETAGFLTRCGLAKGSYILYVSRLEHPAKNHLRLIQAYEQLPKELTDKYSLVLIGSPWKNAEALTKYVETSPLRDKIHFPGFVPSEELPEAYRGAVLYIFPSCYEGFGLSLVEAMHYGIPCCCSNNSSLGEIGQGAALLFPPDSVEAIREAMQKILENQDGIREKLIEAGYKRASQFDWTQHAASIVKMYDDELRRNPPRQWLLGIRFDAVTRRQATERLMELAEDARRNQSPAQQIVTVNVQILVNARCRYPQLLPIINQAALVVADGAPLVVLSRLFSPPRLPERVAGSDMIYDIAAEAAKRGFRVYFLGGEETSALQAINILQTQNPGLEVSGHSSPMIAMSPSADEQAAELEVCRQIVAARTDILLVGLGNPKQELFIQRNADNLPGIVAIGLGGTFNFVSGRVNRAPRWIQRLGLEWVYRIIQEPRRLFLRYFTDAFMLAWLLLCEPFRRKGE